LYIKNELNNIANENILVSWLLSSSNAPIPSVSMTNTLIWVPSYFFPSIGVPHIQSPLVQGLTVGPTPKPFYLLSIILFIRYDFPVLYIPTIDTTPKGPSINLII